MLYGKNKSKQAAHAVYILKYSSSFLTAHERDIGTGTDISISNNQLLVDTINTTYVQSYKDIQEQKYVFA